MPSGITSRKLQSILSCTFSEGIGLIISLKAIILTFCLRLVLNLTQLF